MSNSHLLNVRHFATQLKQNQFYQIYSPYSDKKVVIKDADVKNGTTVIQWDSGEDNAEWIIYPMDGDSYILGNKNSGKMMVIKDANTANGTPLVQWDSGEANANWNFIKNADDSYLIRSQLSGKMMVIKDAGKGNGTPIVEWDSHNGNGVWNLHPTGNTFTIPTLPEVQELPDSPEYSESGGEGQSLPSETEPVTIGADLIPAVMVTDNQWTKPLQMRYSPYYILEKRQYWSKIVNLSLAPGESQTTSYKYGVTITDQSTIENTLNLSFGSDAGLSFKGITKSKKRDISNSLHMSETHSSTRMTESDQSVTMQNPFQDSSMNYAKYILVNQFVLTRTDGTVANIWTMSDNMTVHTTSYPKMKKDS